MAGKSIEELTKDISDPTDFPKEEVAPGLQGLDQACRCSICGDIFDAPMTLQCGHSFCSLCVRQFLRERHECPSCRAPSEEIHLSKNVSAEEISIKWKVARPFIMDLIGKVSSPARPAKRRRMNFDMRTSLENTPKALRKDRSLPTKRSRSSTEEQESEVLEILSETEEAQLVHPELVPSSDIEENDSISDQDDLVDCPICSEKTRLRHINVHMDSGCKQHIATENPHSSKKQRDKVKSQWNSMFSTSTTSNGTKGKGKAKHLPDVVGEHAERLPKPTYHSLKEKKIREMLAEFDLPAHGTRNQLVARHTQFVLLYNANLDRPLPFRKKVSELQRELRAWEEGLSVKKFALDDSSAYLKAQNAEFKKRIEEARASHVRNKVKLDEASTPSEQADAMSSRPQEEANPGMTLEFLGNEAKQATPDLIIPDSEDEAVKL